MTAPIKGVIFDKDGTLFDFDRTWGPVTGAMIRRECGGDPGKTTDLATVLGFDLRNDRFFPGSLVIASTADAVEAAVLPFTADQNLSALQDRMRQATSDVPQVPVADLPTVLDDLRDMGLILGVATNDAECPAHANLDQHGIRDRFAFIAGFDSGFGAKPAPGQLIGFCTQTGLAPENCVMVGDSTHDLDAGRAAGMRCVGVLTGPAPKAQLDPFADVVLASVADLQDWITQINQNASVRP